MKLKLLLFTFLLGLLSVFGANESKIKNFVVIMLENRSFDHLLGHLKRENPSIDGLTGKETNPMDPSKPDSPKVNVTFDCPLDTLVNPGHSIPATSTQIWGSSKRVDPAPMNGFIKDMINQGYGAESPKIMQQYNASTVSVISTLAKEYAVFDRYYSSVPGPTFPNRMYFLSGTSHGATTNDVGDEIIGYPQRIFFDDLWDENHSFKIYFSDFPSCTILSRVRHYPLHLKTMSSFFTDAAEGELPRFSWLEPRFFNFLAWKENDQHPHTLSSLNNGNVAYGEFLLKEVYEAVRASPQWNETALIITYDEHGGCYDHVPPPQTGVPNPDGLNGTSFNFDRLGVRVPMIVISPWIKKGTVVHEPEVNHYEHPSVMKTVRKMWNLKSPYLTKREEWAASFEHIFDEKSPRTDCPMTVSIARGTENQWVEYMKAQKTPETPENIEKMLDQRPEFITESPSLTDLQKEIIRIAAASADTPIHYSELKNLYEAGIFIRNQAKNLQKHPQRSK